MEGRTDASIQEITEAAGLGFGTLYNHFASKDELFDAALEETLVAYGELRDELVAGVEDPAEVFAVTFRLLGRLAEESPAVMRMFMHADPDVSAGAHGLRPKGLHDLRASKEAGRFDFDDLDLAFMTAAGAMLGMLRLLDVDPSRDVARTTDQTVLMTLRMLGMSRQDATQMVERALPVAPSLSSFLRQRRAH